MGVYNHIEFHILNFKNYKFGVLLESLRHKRYKRKLLHFRNTSWNSLGGLWNSFCLFFFKCTRTRNLKLISILLLHHEEQKFVYSLKVVSWSKVFLNFEHSSGKYKTKTKQNNIICISLSDLWRTVNDSIQLRSQEVVIAVISKSMRHVGMHVPYPYVSIKMSDIHVVVTKSSYWWFIKW